MTNNESPRDADPFTADQTGSNSTDLAAAQAAIANQHEDLYQTHRRLRNVSVVGAVLTSTIFGMNEMTYDHLSTPVTTVNLVIAVGWIANATRCVIRTRHEDDLRPTPQQNPTQTP